MPYLEHEVWRSIRHQIQLMNAQAQASSGIVNSGDWSIREALLDLHNRLKALESK